MSEDGCRLYLSTLEEICRQTGWIVHAYALMRNHYHLLFETPEPNLVAGMKWFQGTYTQRFNAMFARHGHLFEGRYKALPVETSSEGYFREVGQYIHLNPFRACLAGTGKQMPLEKYYWSSYPFYAGARRKFPQWLCRSRLYAACGIDEGQSGYIARYKALIESRMLGECDELQDEERKTIERKIFRGWYVGGKAFGAELAGQIGRATDNLRGAQRRAHNEAEAERLLASALAALEIEERALLKMKSTVPEIQAVAWLLKKNTAVTGVWIADRLKMGHRVNVSRAVSAVDRGAGKTYIILKTKMLQCTG